MQVPEVRFAFAADDVRVAYQDFGEGPVAVYSPSLFTHLEVRWEHELVRRMFERLAANLRVVLFDHRGSGLSDGFDRAPSLKSRAGDISAVMDACAVDRASVIGHSAGAQVAAAFAAEHPARTHRLVIANGRVGPSAKEAADARHPDTVLPLAPISFQSRLASASSFGMEPAEDVILTSPSAAAHPDYVQWLMRARRQFVTRDAYRRQIESIIELDIVDLVSGIEAPTMITHAVDNRLFHVGHARLLAELLPHATLVEYEGADQDYWLARNWREIVDAHIQFVTGSEVQAPSNRRFAVVLFTDLVDSARTAVTSGDREWQRRLDLHDRISRRVVIQEGGTLVKHTGDGFLAVFGQPSAAVTAAVQLRAELAVAELQIRAGVHAGEVDVRGDDISGAVVNLAARVQQAAPPSQIYTTTSIRELLIGSLLGFEDAGVHELKGFEGSWSLWRVVD